MFSNNFIQILILESNNLKWHAVPGNIPPSTKWHAVPGNIPPSTPLDKFLRRIL